MSKIIEARAVISAADHTGGVFDKIAKKIEAMSKMGKKFEGFKPFQELNTAPIKKTADEMDRLNKAWVAFDTALRSKGPIGAAKYFGAVEQFHGRMADTLNKSRVAMEKHEASQQRFGRRMARVAGYAGTALGVGGVAYGVNRAGRAGITAAATGARESARDYLAGIDPKDSVRLSRGAMDLSSRYNSVDASTMHERLRDTAMSMRSVDKAMELGDTIAEGTVVLQSFKGKDQAIIEGRKFFKAIDTLGKNIDPKQVRGLFNGYIKALGVEGADLNLGGALQMARQSRAAGGALSDRFMLTTGTKLQGDMGDAQVGTALASSLSQNIGGRATKTSKAVQQAYGLRDKNGKFLNSDLAMSDPDKWAWQHLMPAMQKKGVDVDNKISVAAAASQLFSNRNVSDIFSKMISDRQQYQGAAEQYAAAPGLKAGKELPLKDPFVAYEGLWAQLRNLATQAPIMDAAAAGLTKLSGAIGSFTKDFSEDDTAGKVGKGLAVGGIGVGAVTGGVMAARAGYQWFTGASALTGSAAALDGAAGALTRAAFAISGGKSVTDVFGDPAKASSAAPGAAASKPSIWSRISTGVSKAAPFGALAGGAMVPAAILGGGIWAASKLFPDDAESAGRRSTHGRAVRDAYRARFGDDNARWGTQQNWSGPSQTDTYNTGAPGSVNVTGEATINSTNKIDVAVNFNTEMFRAEVASMVNNVISKVYLTNGPGSTGLSSPDAAAPRPSLGYGGSH